MPTSGYDYLFFCLFPPLYCLSGRLMTARHRAAAHSHAERSKRAPLPRPPPPSRRSRRRPPTLLVLPHPHRCWTPRASASPRGSRDAPARWLMDMALARPRRCSEHVLFSQAERAFLLFLHFSHAPPSPPQTWERCAGRGVPQLREALAVCTTHAGTPTRRTRPVGHHTRRTWLGLVGVRVTLEFVSVYRV